jgi:hypothetical protein
MFNSDTPTYSIDLRCDESRRWLDVLAAERETARQLFDEAAAVFEKVPRLLRWVFARLYESKGGLYVDEIRSWSSGVGVSEGTAVMLNCAYELSHLRVPKIFGCTAGVRWVEGIGMVHVRNLDWPLPGMGPATRVFRFHRDGRSFVSASVPGQVGILSGMLPGAYSVTINWAPPVSFPTFEFGPTFLLRDVLETCDTYDLAVHRLTSTLLSTSVFFTVCGVEKGQACVIERTASDAEVRPMRGTALVQANHHVAARFAKNNADIVSVPEGEEEFSLEGSGVRVDQLCGALDHRSSPRSLDDAATALNATNVLNKFTVQQMVFCPGTGEVKVWRRT